MSRLHHVRPSILAELRHLDISRRVRVTNTMVVSTGAYGDISQGFVKKKNATILVAIKRLRICNDADITTLFEKEIYVWSKLRHSNILPLLGFAFDSNSGYPMFISTWMENGSLRSYLNDTDGSPEYDIFRLVMGVAEGLRYLHDNGVIHSDIKPDNVLISSLGDAVICDFGVSRMALASRTIGQLSTDYRGTSRYYAYELLAFPDSKNSKESDVWAFGMTVYEVLTRQLPYATYIRDGQILVAIVKQELPFLPPSFDPMIWPGRHVDWKLLWDICQDCWIHDPSTRVTMGEIIHNLLLVKTSKLPMIRADWWTFQKGHKDLPTGLEHQDGPTAAMNANPLAQQDDRIYGEETRRISELYMDGTLPVLPIAERLFTPVYAYLDRISLHHGDILKLEVDALVYEPDGYNLNPSYVRDNSLSSKLHAAGGPGLLKAYKSLIIDPGDVEMTSGYKLLAKNVIHARGPGPFYSGQYNAHINVPHLASCYRRSLELGNKNRFQNIAFSPISTYDDSEFPVEDATRIALEETRRFLDLERFHGTLRLGRIIFVTSDDRHREAYDKLIPYYFPARAIGEHY